jgi:hypothetical protein
MRNVHFESEEVMKKILTLIVEKVKQNQQAIEGQDNNNNPAGGATLNTVPANRNPGGVAPYGPQQPGGVAPYGPQQPGGVAPYGPQRGGPQAPRLPPGPGGYPGRPGG